MSHSATKLVAASEDKPPRWIVKPPAKSVDSIYFVGLSNVENRESLARKSALEFARGEFAEYVGVDIHKVNTLLQKVYGKNNDVFNHSSRFFQQKVDANVRQIHAVNWYWEKYRSSADPAANSIGNEFFKYWVLVEVPVSEYEKILVEKQADNKRQELLVADTVAQIIATSVQRRTRVTQLIKQTDILKAISELTGEWQRLAKLKNEFNQKNKYYKSHVPDLSIEQDKVLAIILELEQAIVLDKGIIQHHYISAQTDDIPVWTFYRQNEKTLPVSGLILKLVDENGLFVAKASSNNSGKASFSSEKLAPGSYQVSIDKDAFEQGLQPGELSGLFKQSLAVFQLSRTDSDLSGAVKLGLSGVFSQPSNRFFKKVRLGSVFDKNTGREASMSKEIKNQIEREISGLNQIQLLTAESTEQASAGVDEAGLDVTYSNSRQYTHLNFNLVELSNHQPIASSNSSIALFPSEPNSTGGKRWYKRWYTWASVGTVAAILLIACSGGGEGGDAGQGGSGGGCSF